MNRTLNEGCVAGVDPHKRTLTVTILDSRGGLLGTRTFKVSGEGHRSMTAWADQLGTVRVWRGGCVIAGPSHGRVPRRGRIRCSRRVPDAHG